MNRDPVHEENGKWWFWDEVWVNRYGPYDTEAQACEAMDKYAQEILSG